MVKVVSFCLFGENEGYIHGFIGNIKVIDEYYPGWDVVCYISEKTFGMFEKQLLPVLGRVRFIVMDTQERVGGMFWRFFASEIADIFVCRDADSLFSHKEYVAVNEWLTSDKDFHIIRDHQYHGEKIMGGMWGYKGSSLGNMRELIASYGNNGYSYNSDQMFLADVIYPMTKGNAVIHDERFNIDPEARGFPDFIYDEENPHIGHVYFSK